MGTRTCSIPRIIHQTWKDENIPERWRASPAAWQRLHPGWTYILWTDAGIRRYVAERWPQLLAMHDAFPHGIQRADMIRYLVLYDYGGVYSDLDLYPTTSIEPYIDKCTSAYVVFSANTNCFTNALMVSQARNPMWLEVVAAVQARAQNPPWWAWGKHLHVMSTTGPLMLTDVLRATASTYAVLPQTLFNPYSVDALPDAVSDRTVIHTLPGSSWHAWDSSLYNHVFKHRVAFAVAGAVLVVAVIVALVCYVYKYRRCRAAGKCYLKAR